MLSNRPSDTTRVLREKPKRILRERPPSTIVEKTGEPLKQPIVEL